MAIYSLNCKMIQRSKNKSSVGKAAYIGGRILTDEKDENNKRTFNYTKKKEVVYSQIFAPQYSPQWVYDPAKLWNAVEFKEIRKDAQVAREIMIALPIELPLNEQIKLIEAYVQENFIALGMIADVNIHAKENNPHVHILLTTRKIKEQILIENQNKSKEASPNLNAAMKIENDDRSAMAIENSMELEELEELEELDELNEAEESDEAEELDKNKEINFKDSNFNHNIFGNKMREWDKKNFLQMWRTSWRILCNEYLQKNGFNVEINEKSYKDRKINKLPTLHLGYPSKISKKIDQFNGNVNIINQKIGDINNLIMRANYGFFRSIDPIKQKKEELQRHIEDFLHFIKKSHDDDEIQANGKIKSLQTALKQLEEDFTKTPFHNNNNNSAKTNNKRRQQSSF